jgi:hypothetical protein
VKKLKVYIAAAWHRQRNFKMRMKNPVFHQDSLFVVRGYNVLRYTVQADLLIFDDSFPFPDPVEEIKSEPEGLLVTTTRSWFIIAGGPQAATYYAQLIADRSPNTVLTREGILQVRSVELLKNPLAVKGVVRYVKA